VARFLGGMPQELPDRYAEASPRERLPLGVRQILVHGDADLSVPYAQSVSYVDDAAGEAELVTLAGAGHFELIDPQAGEFPATVTAIRSLLEPSPQASAR
jgi:pimeloyl-ACP methyl ester carboxylesterase